MNKPTGSIPEAVSGPSLSGWRCPLLPLYIAENRRLGQGE